MVGAIVLFMASIPYWNGGFTPGLMAPLGFVLSIFGGIGLGLRGLSKHHWRVGVVGIGLNAIAIVVLALSFANLRS